MRRVRPLHSERPRPLEAPARAPGATPGTPGSQRSHAPWRTSSLLPRRRRARAGRGSMGRARAPPPRRLRGDPDRDGTAHGVADQQRTAGAEVDGRPGVGHARVERLPALDPVAHLGERDLRVPRREFLREQLARGAPGSRNLLRRAAVREHGGETCAFVPQARVGARGQRHEPRAHAGPAVGMSGLRPPSPARGGSRYPARAVHEVAREQVLVSRRPARPSRRAARSCWCRRPHGGRRRNRSARRRHGRSSPTPGTDRDRSAEPRRQSARKRASVPSASFVPRLTTTNGGKPRGPAEPRAR